MKNIFKLMKRMILVLLLIIFIISFFFIKQIRENVRQVKIYEQVVESAVVKEKIPERKELILAIIYTETKGNANDLMQSSESVYGQSQLIASPIESIEFGVDFFSRALSIADEQGCDLWTAVQAYNFGLDYIYFVAENGGNNTIELAEKYSREVLSPLLNNPERETYRYLHPQAMIYNGGYLYYNGGNFFYADHVKWNMNLLKWF